MCSNKVDDLVDDLVDDFIETICGPLRFTSRLGSRLTSQLCKETRLEFKKPESGFKNKKGKKLWVKIITKIGQEYILSKFTIEVIKRMKIERG